MASSDVAAGGVGTEARPAPALRALRQARSCGRARALALARVRRRPPRAPRRERAVVGRVRRLLGDEIVAADFAEARARGARRAADRAIAAGGGGRRGAAGLPRARRSPRAARRCAVHTRSNSRVRSIDVPLGTNTSWPPQVVARRTVRVPPISSSSASPFDTSVFKRTVPSAASTTSTTFVSRRVTSSLPDA